MEHVVWKPRSADEMHRLEELAQAAVGFDARRGDQVVIQNVSFSTNAPEMKPPVMDRLMEEARALLHAQPGLDEDGDDWTLRRAAGAVCAAAGGQAGYGNAAGAAVVAGWGEGVPTSLKRPEVEPA